MRTSNLILVSIVTYLIAAPALAQAPTAAPTNAGGSVVSLTLSSTTFADGGQFPVRFSAAAPGVAPGEGVSPPLVWSNAPSGTQSFVLHMHDLDVTRNKTTDDQLHWLVWNIPATATGLAEGAVRGSKLADGSSQISASGPLYRGPGAPANGPFHHYLIELFALDTVLPVQPTGDGFETRVKVIAALQGHILGKAVYSAFFRRPN